MALCCDRKRETHQVRLTLVRAVVIDANGFLLPFQFRINLDAELTRLLGTYEILVPRQVLKELETLAQTDQRAEGALKLARKYREVNVATGNADDAVVDLAIERSATVLTNDRGLLRRLKKLRVARIYLRSQSHLVLEGA